MFKYLSALGKHARSQLNTEIMRLRSRGRVVTRSPPAHWQTVQTAAQRRAVRVLILRHCERY